MPPQGDPSSISVQNDPVSDDDLLVALRGSAALEMLGLTSDDDLVEAAGASVTVGLAEMRSEDSLEDLIGRADEALYEQRGRTDV